MAYTVDWFKSLPDSSRVGFLNSSESSFLPIEQKVDWWNQAAMSQADDLMRQHVSRAQSDPMSEFSLAASKLDPKTVRYDFATAQSLGVPGIAPKLASVGDKYPWTDVESNSGFLSGAIDSAFGNSLMRDWIAPAIPGALFAWGATLPAGAGSTMTAEQAIASNAAENQWMNSALRNPLVYDSPEFYSAAAQVGMTPAEAATLGSTGMSGLQKAMLLKQGLGLLSGSGGGVKPTTPGISLSPISGYKGYTPTNFMSNAGSPSGSTPTQVAMMTPAEKETLLQAVLKSKPKEFAKYIG